MSHLATRKKMQNSNIWACEETALLNYLDMTLNTPDIDASIVAQFGEAAESESIYTVVGSTAFMNIRGFMSNSGPNFFERLFGIEKASYPDIIQAASEIEDNPVVKNVQINMNTPGGDVFGVDEAAQAIARLSGVKKTRVVNEGMIASAGYWIASQAGEILASAPTSITGSIGVIITAVDREFNSENKNVVRARIVSRNAPNKAPDLKTEEGRGVLQDRADSLERIFIQRVAEGRNVSEDVVKSDFGRGGVLVARDPDEKQTDALRSGMIDGLITISRTKDDVTGGLNISASIDKETDNMTTNFEGLTVQDLRAGAGDLIADIEAKAAAGERERIQKIEGLMSNVAELPSEVRAKVRGHIDAKKFDTGATAESIGVELLGVIARAQNEFVASKSSAPREAAKIAEELTTKQEAPEDDKEVKASESKSRVEGLAAGMKGV
jgi:ClpP class serine protease